MTIKVNITHTKSGKNEHVKHFTDTQEMLDYAFKLADEAKTSEIVVSRGKDSLTIVDNIESYDYEVEIYDYYRE